MLSELAEVRLAALELAMHHVVEAARNFDEDVRPDSVERWAVRFENFVMLGTTFEAVE